MNQIKLSKLIIKVDKLPAQLNNFTILQLSDFHFKKNAPTNFIKKITSNLNPDIVVLTGDYIKGNDGIFSCLDIINSIKTKYGIYGILGNHDYRYNLNQLIGKLKENNVNMLINKNAKIKIKNKNIWIIGVDVSVYDDPLDLHRANLSLATKDVPEKDFKILLTHSPDIIEEAVAKKINLVITGHTHGGQICFPFIGPLYASSKYRTKYASGLFKKYETYMYVTRGIGNVNIPLFPFSIRFNCPPEITLIKLVKGETIC